MSLPRSIDLDRCYVGDCRAVMRQLIADGTRAQCVITSPPYWGLRDYGVGGQLGLERSPMRYLARMRSVFRLVRELLSDDGTLWLNMGDGYAGSLGSQMNQGSTGQMAGRSVTNARARPKQQANVLRQSKNSGLKPKDLIGMPWMLALILRADGWYLRSDIIWHKPNPMPESITDRPTKAHEYLFLLAKSERYYYDADAIKEPVTGNAHARGDGVNRKIKMPDGWDTSPGTHRQFHRHGRERGTTRPRQNASFSSVVNCIVDSRNKRSVWTVPTQPFSEAHFATFPEKLIEPCILAGSRPGDIVFDPFMGSGTVGSVSARLGRRWLGSELNPDYTEMQRRRTAQTEMQLA